MSSRFTSISRAAIISVLGLSNITLRCLLLSPAALFSGVIPQIAEAQVVSIGFPDLGEGVSREEFSLFSQDTPLARVAAQADFDTLTVADAGPRGYRLSASDQMMVSSDYRTWSFRARTNSQFHNGKVVTGDDLQYSLKRCQSRNELEGVSEINSRVVERAVGSFEYWVDIEIELPKDDLAKAPLRLARCPIIERESAELFGTELGMGSLVVGSGSYRLSDYVEGRELVFSRVARSGVIAALGKGGLEQSAPSLVLKTFKDPRQGLTALRVGTLDAFFTEDVAVISAAKVDETLSLRRCLSYNVIARKGLSFNCDPTLQVTSLRYRGS